MIMKFRPTAKSATADSPVLAVKATRSTQHQQTGGASSLRSAAPRQSAVLASAAISSTTGRHNSSQSANPPPSDMNKRFSLRSAPQPQQTLQDRQISRALDQMAAEAAPRKRGRPPRQPVADSSSSSVVAGLRSGQRAQQLHSTATPRPKAAHDSAEVLLSKRMPKPNPRYMNEHTVSKVSTSDEDDDADGQDDEDEEAAASGLRAHRNRSSNDDDKHTIDGGDGDDELEQSQESDLDRSQDEEHDDQNADDDHNEHDEEQPARALRGRPPGSSSAQQLSHSVPANRRGRPPKNADAVAQKPAATGALLARRPGIASGKRKLDDTSDSAGESDKRRQMATRRSAIVQSDIDDNEGSDEDYKEPQRPQPKRQRTSAPSALDHTLVAPPKNPIASSTPTAGSQNSSPQLAAKRSALVATLKKLNNSAPAMPSSPVTPLNQRANPKQTIKREGDANNGSGTPTFTIVNINDIINQKKDFVLEQLNQVEGPKILQRRPGRPRRVHAAIDDDVDYQPSIDSEADEQLPDDDDDRVRHTSRRKAQHMSAADRMRALSKQQSPTALVAGSPKLLNAKANGPADAGRPAPRILNSTLCRNVSKLEAQPQIHTFRRNALAAQPLKTYSPNRSNSSATAAIGQSNTSGGATTSLFRGTLNNVAAAAGLHKKPANSERTVVSHQMVASGGTSRRVRKVTCYETWFVIKLPPDEQQQAGPKPELAISLTLLGNQIDSVALPSDAWTCKISLQRRPMLANGASNADANELYTGNLQDPMIPESDRSKVAPNNIMFRRSNANPLLPMQFDRAIVLKAKAFFVNIEGKNVRLLAAPTQLKSVADVETLLQIVDGITLESSCVEITPFL